MSPSRALERGRLRGQRTGIPWPLGGTSGSGAVPLPGAYDVSWSESDASLGGPRTQPLIMRISERMDVERCRAGVPRP
jgi:hypothetical protein